MKIAVIGVKGLPAHQGGIEHYCQEMYPALAAQGHQVVLFARQEYTQQKSFKSIYAKVQVTNLPSIPHGGVDALLNTFLATLLCLFGRYDVIHFHALGPAFFCFLPRLFLKSKIVVTCHGLDWRRAKWDRFSKVFLKWGELMAVSFAHELIVVSESLQHYFSLNYGRQTSFIPTAPAPYADSDPVFPFVRSQGLSVGRYVVYLGRMVPEKRPELLLQAFQRLENTSYKLAFVGGTSHTDFFAQQLIQQAENDSRIVFTGELVGERLAEMIRGAGIFVLPSDLEGFPLVLLEAMREGIPVIASDIEPHRFILGTNRGRLFKAGNVDDCARCLVDAMDKPKESAEMAKLAQDYVLKTYQWSQITQDNLYLYHKRLSRSGRPGRFNSNDEIKNYEKIK